MLNVSDTHDVGEYTGSSYAGSGTIALNHHRVFLIALGGEQHDVVGTFQIVERMLRTDSLQTYACLAAIQGSNEAPAFVLYIERLALSLEIGIEFRKFLPEVVERTLEVFVWHEEVLLYIFLLYAVTCLAGENHQLANHVHTAQVDTWIRLAVALLLSQSYGLREWNDAGDGVEDKVERT